jgi:hypothetical protein
MMRRNETNSVKPFMNIGRAGNCLTILLLFASLFGCERVQVNVIDSGYEIEGGESRPAWLDDHRVMFNKPTIGKHGRIPAPPGLYIWDVDANTMERYADVGDAPCYDNGYIHYFTHYEGAGKKRIFFYKYGEMGKEKTIKLQWNDDIGFNPYDCRLMSLLTMNELNKSKSRNIKPLRMDHGYLDIGDTKGNLKLIKPSGEVLELPIPKLDARNERIYYPFRGAYYLYYQGGPGYWLYPDGRVEKVTVPEGPWLGGGSILQRQSKAGLFVISHAVSTGDGGLYLVKGSKVKKLISGMLHHALTSPDGCKLAFLYADKYGYTNAQYFLQALDVCKLEQQR